MKTVLILYEKHGNRVFDISTEELKLKAALEIFNERKKEGYYHDFAEMGSKFYDEASKGNAKSALRVLRYRNDYEYEKMEEIMVE
jgi:hypothetical protein